MNETMKKFDETEFIKQFSGALDQIGNASYMGKKLADEGIERVYFAGCGAPYYMMKLLAYWGLKCAHHTDIRVYHASELVSQNPAALDKKTLVILGSHSGTTQETTEAAAFLKPKPCKTIAITQLADSPLALAADQSLLYGLSNQGYFSAFILAQTLFSAFLNEREENWDFHPALMASLPNLPFALAEAKSANMIKAAVQANLLVDQNLVYVVGAGPMATTAFVFASCFLMEMQWIHAHALIAADFFHGPFEVIDKTTPVVALIGESPSRPEGERVKKFCSRHTGNSIVYDSLDYEMTGIQETARPIVAPLILDSALTALVEQLAVIRDHPLATRRYMGKVAY